MALSAAKRRELDGRQQHLFKPETTWTVPTLPHVPDGTTIAIDTETRDRGLAEGRGPGWVSREGGHLCGVSWAFRTDEGICRGYAPVRHPDTACLDPEVVLGWLQDVASRCDLVFQNASYDLGWTGIRVTRPVGDTLAMAVLIDENLRAYNLDAICAWLGIPGKDESLLVEAVHKYGLDASTQRAVKGNMWQLPARYTGPYAEQDAESTLLCAERMRPMIQTQDLGRAYALETELIPHVLEMRRRGIRINVDRAEQNQRRLRELARAELDALRPLLGVQHRRQITIEDVRSPRWLTQVFTELGVAFPRTPPTEKHEDGQPSFEKEWLERCPHPVGQRIAQARRLHDGAEKFIGNYILDHLERGRIHAEIHQLRSEEGGTKTFRFSYSDPPLQQMNRAEPDKTNPEHKDYIAGFVDVGTMIRECFEPEPGCVWNAPDYSQQEYRLIVHNAALLELPGADEAVRYYTEDPDADYHNFVVSMTGLTRKRAKDCNFAKAFGAGVPKFALMTGMTLEEAATVMRQYDERLPFVAMFAKRASAHAERKGYIRLLDGRRCHFDEWEAGWVPPEEWERGRAMGMTMTPCSLQEAHRRQENPDHPWRGKRLRRAGTHKAGNRRIQGSAAVQTKMALLECAREGYLPMLQMHDELGFSHASQRDCDRTAEIMRDVVRLRVPVKVDDESGSNWGNAKYTFARAMELVRSRA